MLLIYLLTKSANTYFNIYFYLFIKTCKHPHVLVRFILHHFSPNASLQNKYLCTFRRRSEKTCSVAVIITWGCFLKVKPQAFSVVTDNVHVYVDIKDPLGHGRESFIATKKKLHLHDV